MSSKATRIRVGAAGLAIAAVAAFGGGATANAWTAQDNAFFTTLRMQGITLQGGGASAVRIAHAICADRADGISREVVVEKLITQVGLSRYNAGYFAGAATRVYCPKYL